MNIIKITIVCLASAIICPVLAQKYVIQETNIAKKPNASQFMAAAKRCEMVLLKKQTVYTLAISNKSTLTTNSINALAEKFTRSFPKSIDPMKGEEQVVIRGFENKSADVVQLTFCTLLPNQYVTKDFIQLIVTFDSSDGTPKIANMQVKSVGDLGDLTLTEREIHPPVVKPAPAAAKKAPAKKPAAKKTPAKKPATKK